MDWVGKANTVVLSGFVLVNLAWLVVMALDFLMLVQAALAAVGLAAPTIEASFYFVCRSAISLLVI